MSVQTSVSSSHRAADAGRGLLALLGVAVSVAGVPSALVGWVGSPLPAGVPTVSEVTHAAHDTFIPDELLVKVLALACWLVWIEMVASLLVEAVAYARGRKAGAVPLAGGLQRGAARLIAAVALLGRVVATRGGSGMGALADQPLVVAAPAVPVAVQAPDAGLAAARVAPAEVRAAAPGRAGRTSLPTYEVQRRDTLWDIAERHLGDPLRWPEIFRLNEGCPQADGRCLVDPDLIRVGWRFALPADAHSGGTAGVVAAPARPADHD